MGYSLKFRMNLTEFPSHNLVLGTLNVKKDGTTVDSYQVTSGVPPYQFEGTESKRARGPIPRCSAARVNNYDVWTSPTYQPQVIGIEGTFYNIDPEKVTVIDPFTGDMTSRSEFGIHFDANVPGSAGCVVFRQRGEYKQFESLMTDLREQGIKTIPLDVDYNVHARTWSITIDGDFFMKTDSEDGIVRVPVRAFAERFPDAAVKYDSKKQAVTVKGKPLSSVSFPAGVAHAPIRQLASIVDATIEVNGSNIKVSG